MPRVTPADHCTMIFARVNSGGAALYGVEPHKTATTRNPQLPPSRGTRGLPMRRDGEPGRLGSIAC